MTSNDAWEQLRKELQKHFSSDLEIIGYSVDAVEPGYAIAQGAEWPLFELSIKTSNLEAINEKSVSEADVVTLAICHCSLGSGECDYDDSDSILDNQLIQDCPRKTNVKELI